MFHNNSVTLCNILYIICYVNIYLNIGDCEKEGNYKQHYAFSNGWITIEWDNAESFFIDYFNHSNFSIKYIQTNFDLILNEHVNELNYDAISIGYQVISIAIWCINDVTSVCDVNQYYQQLINEEKKYTNGDSGDSGGSDDSDGGKHRNDNNDSLSDGDIVIIVICCVVFVLVMISIVLYCNWWKNQRKHYTYTKGNTQE